MSNVMGKKEFVARDFLVKYGFIMVTLIAFIAFYSTQDTFRMSTTFFSMLKYTSVVAITGLGITFAMAVGGLDLSVGAVAGMSVTLSAMTMVIYDKSAPVAVGSSCWVANWRIERLLNCWTQDSRSARNSGFHVCNYGFEASSSTWPFSVIWNDDGRWNNSKRKVH
jgi:hypothetical protein